MYTEPKVNVLLVDDRPENLMALEAILEKMGQNLVKAHSGQEALRCLLEQDFAAILLDVQMPGMDGFETATLIRQREKSRSTPILFLTAFSTSDTLRFKGYSLGAVDYILKPIEPEILASKVGVFVELYQKNAALKRQTAQLAAMNAELRQSEERFRILSNCSPVGIFLADLQGRCTYTNPRCQSICGAKLEETLGNWTELLHPEDREKARLSWLVYIQEGKQEFSEEYRFLSSDHQISWTHIRASVMLADGGEPIGYVGTIEDIAERKQAEEARANFICEQVARQQAESANRMKDEFLAVLSHELRTPLNSILGWAQMLRTRSLSGETAAKALETIERNARLQADLIEDILDVSRIIRGKLRLTLRPITISPLIEACLQGIRPAAEAKSIQVISNNNITSELISADPDRLQQVINNLLSNAIKFTPSGGRIEVITESKTEESMICPNSSFNNNSAESELISSFYQVPYLQIQVKDTGIGISPEFLPHIFDRFRQADSSTTRHHGGLGLGLAIAHHLVKLQGGVMMACSAGKNQGATFTILLPLVMKSDRPSLDSSPIRGDYLMESPEHIPVLEGF